MIGFAGVPHVHTLGLQRVTKSELLPSMMRIILPFCTLLLHAQGTIPQICWQTSLSTSITPGLANREATMPVSHTWLCVPNSTCPKHIDRTAASKNSTDVGRVPRHFMKPLWATSLVLAVVCIIAILRRAGQMMSRVILLSHIGYKFCASCWSLETECVQRARSERRRRCPGPPREGCSQHKPRAGSPYYHNDNVTMITSHCYGLPRL
jgi:hypothetical protein